jgi:hypothetical protein
MTWEPLLYVGTFVLGLLGWFCTRWLPRSFFVALFLTLLPVAGQWLGVMFVSDGC